MDPHLDAFVKRGGKLIRYHGWSDSQIAPSGSVDYYKNVLNVAGTKIQDSYRLFMVPVWRTAAGVTAPPLSMRSRRSNNGWKPVKHPRRFRPRVFGCKVRPNTPALPYPQLAVYKGSGSTDDAANFECK
jgi:feruloyl esterase